jgi:hypothetical protein
LKLKVQLTIQKIHYLTHKKNSCQEKLIFT